MEVRQYSNGVNNGYHGARARPGRHCASLTLAMEVELLSVEL